ncbi:hypothetical protein [Natronococcus amylolyticus]|nr:hypothetical protein [Natronococcus amylolyticus]
MVDRDRVLVFVDRRRGDAVLVGLRIELEGNVGLVWLALAVDLGPCNRLVRRVGDPSGDLGGRRFLAVAVVRVFLVSVFAIRRLAVRLLAVSVFAIRCLVVPVFII